MKRFFSPERKKVIFLDMNRTLLDPEASFDEAFLTVWHDFTGRWDGDASPKPEEALARFRREWKPPSPALGKGSTAADNARLKAFHAAVNMMKIGFSAPMAKQFFRMVQEAQGTLPKLYPGVRETLDRLSRTYTLAVISNGSRQRQENQMERLGLEGLIPPARLFTFQKGGMRKPKSAIFQHALESMQIDSSQGIMVGNSWKTDIMGAAGVGLDAVWIHPSHAKKSSLRKVGDVKVAVVRRFEQLTDIL